MVSIPCIAVVIPTYRAEKYILKVLSGIPDFVSYIVVVNDCSPDRSEEVIKTCQDPRLHLVSHQKNQGVGGAVLTGYAEAVALGAEIIVKMDSDDQMDPAYLIPLLAPLLSHQADYAKGNRFLHASELNSMPLTRRIGNAGLSFLTKAASGYWNIFDPTNGYTAIDASIIPLLDTSHIQRRYFFESSMLVELGLIRAVICDVQIPARYTDAASSLSEWKSILEFPPRLMASFWRRFITTYFIRDFGAFSMLVLLGICLSLFGLGFGLYHWYLSARTATIASTGTVMVAVLPLILGWQLLIQALIVDIQNIPSKPLHNSLNTLSKFRKILDAQFTKE